MFPHIPHKLLACLVILAIFTGFPTPALGDGCPNAERRTLKRGEKFIAQGDKCWVVDRDFVKESVAKDEVNKKILKDLADEQADHDATRAKLEGEKERVHQVTHKKNKWKRLFITSVVVVVVFVAGGFAGSEL